MKKKFRTTEGGLIRKTKSESVKKTGADFATKKNQPIYFPKKHK